MNEILGLWCQKCDAPCVETSDLCIYCEKVRKVEELGEANTLWCANCGCPCSYNSDSDVDTCIECTKADLADILEEESTSESTPHAAMMELNRRIAKTGLTELKKRIAKQESRLSFLQLQFDTEPGYGGLKGDVVIIVGNRTDEPLYAHKFILSSKSPVFCKMFESKMLEAQTGIIRIDDATLPVMQAMIKFCYSAEINFSHEVPAEDVLRVAHKYEVDHLQEVCEEVLIRTLNKRNLPRRLNLAMKLDATKLKTASSKYFKKHFDLVVWDVLEGCRSPS